MEKDFTVKDLNAQQPTAALAPMQDAGDVSALALAAPQLRKRTAGLWLVDTLIYSLVNNFAVFGISVFATYLTEKGWPNPANGKELAGWKRWVGDLFQSRGQKLDNTLETRFGFAPKTAQMARMVSFSFFDGTFVAPFVKVLEDRREQMAMGIDTALGTKPKDESVYEAEPKQSWKSVVFGRLLTSSIVVPTAVALNAKFSKEKTFLTPNRWLKEGESLNDFFFHNKGENFGRSLEANHPRIKSILQKAFGKIDLPFFMKTVYFEAFYTSVCTTGLYAISRAFARKHPPKQHAILNVTNTANYADLPPSDTSEQQKEPRVTELASTPPTKVTAPTRIDRIMPLPTPELTT